MRRIVVFNSITLDGVMQAPGGRDEDPPGRLHHGGWATAPYRMRSRSRARRRAWRTTDAMLFGRRTYEDLLPHWNKTGGPFKDILNNAPKHIASTTLKEPLPWPNSSLLGGDVPDAVAASQGAARQGHRHPRPPELVWTLMSHDLIDEFLLLIHPLVLGTGRRLFGDDGPMAKLDLSDAHSRRPGVVSRRTGGLDRGRLRPPSGSLRGRARARSARSVRSLISRRSRSSMTAVRWAAMTPRWISSCSIRSWRRSAVSAGSSVARCSRAIAEAGLQPVEQRLMRRASRAGPARSRRGPPGRRPRARPSPRRRRTRRRPSRPTGRRRQREALADERDEDDREGQQQDQVPLRERRPAGPAPPPARRRHGGPPSRRRTSGAWPGAGSRRAITAARRARQQARREHPHEPGHDDDHADQRDQAEDLARGDGRRGRRGSRAARARSARTRSR